MKITKPGQIKKNVRLRKMWPTVTYTPAYDTALLINTVKSFTVQVLGFNSCESHDLGNFEK